LHRKNKEAIEITNLFSKESIKYTTSSDFDIYDTDIGRKFLKLVEAVCRYEDESFIMSVMHIRELGLHPHDIYSVIRKVKDAKQKSLYSFLYDKDVLLELNLINKDSFLKMSLIQCF
jgi:ATP-dependent exoDNAse (exonuclease V) beta subunit